jgi:hypothetical protein
LKTDDATSIMKRLGYRKDSMTGFWSAEMTPKVSMWMDLVFPRWEHNLSNGIKDPKAWRLAGQWAKRKADKAFPKKKTK